MGLELKPSKTRICHTLENLDGKVGFDFLGFEIRQVSRGKNYSAKNTNGKILGYKTRITPSKKSIKTHLKSIREVIDKYRGGTQVALIKQLNPIIRGWCNYYSIGLKRTFSKVQHKVYQMLRAWAKNRHPMKNMHWIVNKYWAVDEGMGWEFVARVDVKFYKLFKHQETPIKRHIKIKANKSPFDADWVYWANRIGELPDVKKQVAKLIKRQKGKCPKCELFFQNEDLMEIHHTDGNHHNNCHKNLLLLHRHCHDQVHSMN